MRKLNTTIILGVLVALVGAILVFLYGNNVQQQIADGKRTVSVVVAKVDIPSGLRPDQIRGMTELDQVPSRYVQANALSSLDRAPVSGVLLGPVVRGAQISFGDFGSPVTQQDVVPPKGKVDVAIEVGLTPGVLRYVNAGSLVDMFVTYGSQSAATAASAGGAPSAAACGVKSGGGSCTKLFATGVKVVSIAAASPSQQAGQTASGQPAPVAQGSNVTCVLEVAPDLAEKIVNAVAGGQIYLALTAQNDPHNTAGTNQADVIGSNR